MIACAAVFLLQPLLWLHLIAAASGAGWANGLPLHYQDTAMDVYLHGDLAQTLRANLWAGQWSKWWFMLETGRVMQIMGLYLVGRCLGGSGSSRGWASSLARAGSGSRWRWVRR